MSQATKTQTEKSSKVTPSKRTVSSPRSEAMPFRRQNYQLLGIGVLMLLIGYSLLLVPGQFVDSREFSPALYIAPVVIMGGFGTLIYAILRR